MALTKIKQANKKYKHEKRREEKRRQEKLKGVRLKERNVAKKRANANYIRNLEREILG